MIMYVLFGRPGALRFGGIAEMILATGSIVRDYCRMDTYNHIDLNYPNNRISLRLILAIIGLCLLANVPFTPAYATDDDSSDSVFDRGCGDDRGTDRCDADIQQEMRDLYGWSNPNEVAALGTQFWRFMMVDGYGRDLAAITFERSRGTYPVVRVEVPKSELVRDAITPPTVLEAGLTDAQWDNVLALTAPVNNTPPAQELPTSDTEALTICLHSWFVVMETDQPFRMTPRNQGSVVGRSLSEGACSDGPAMDVAFELTKAALDALPVCQNLDLTNYRNRVMLLAHCKRMAGERSVAIDASHMVEKLERWLEDNRGLVPEDFFAPDNQVQALAFEQSLRGATLYLEAPYAKDSTTAVVVGEISPADQPEDDENSYRVADIRLYLNKNKGGWIITSYTLSEPRTVTYSE